MMTPRPARGRTKHRWREPRPGWRRRLCRERRCGGCIGALAFVACATLLRRAGHPLPAPVDGDEWVGKKYRQSVAVQPLIELALGLYFTATVFYALANQIYGTVPFLVLFQIGFLYTGLLSIVQQYAGDPNVVTAGLEPGRQGS